MPKKPKTDDQQEACLVAVRELYAKYTPEQITQAFIINRREITQREEIAQLQEDLGRLQQRLDTLLKP